MTIRTRRGWVVAGLALSLSLGAMTTPMLAHHSFAMYDMSANKTMTGKLTRFIPGGNHAQLVFEVIGDDGKVVMEKGKPLVWGVETGSAAAIAGTASQWRAFRLARS